MGAPKTRLGGGGVGWGGGVGGGGGGWGGGGGGGVVGGGVEVVAWWVVGGVWGAFLTRRAPVACVLSLLEGCLCVVSPYPLGSTFPPTGAPKKTTPQNKTNKKTNRWLRSENLNKEGFLLFANLSLKKRREESKHILGNLKGYVWGVCCCCARGGNSFLPHGY